MTHLVEAVAARDRVCLFPGDWFGFRVGATQTTNLAWDASGRGELACLCVPSVRNGHLTEEMLAFLEAAPHDLLNLNLYPTLAADERRWCRRSAADLCCPGRSCRSASAAGSG